MVIKQIKKMTHINTDISKELKTGDFVIVSLHNGCLHLGFYLGRGYGNTVQFYTFTSILWWSQQEKKSKYPYKDYIQGMYVEHRIAKYHPDLIEDEKKKEEYYKCMEILKSLKIIKE